MMDDDEEEVLESDSGVRRSTGRGTRIRDAQTADKQSHPLVMAGLVVTAVLLFYGCFVVLDASRATETSVTQGFSEFVEGMFGGKK